MITSAVANTVDLGGGLHIRRLDFWTIDQRA